jgi:hypothetical protein
MALSLNQIIARLRSLALAHKQINHFFFGDVPEFDSREDITYPACFCEQQPGGIDRVNKQQRFNFRLYFVDLVHVSERTEENETEVLSDMTQVAGDLLSMLMNPLYQDDWTILDTAQVIPVTESLGDMGAGVVMDVSILIDFFADSCQVPAEDVEFDQTYDMPRTKIYNYTATGSEGPSFAIADLSGKHILALWRAGTYKRAVAVAPTDTEKIQVGTVDLGSGKGILGNGTINLEADDALIPTEKLDILYYE